VDLDTYLANAGFAADPFSSTNADTEELLQDYFVPPPYFQSVLGQPSNPESQIVFAPRGGGKSAQRRMIEMASEGSGFLCVLHDSFPVEGKAAVRQTTLDLHLRQVARKLLVAVLLHLDAAPEDSKKLSRDSKSLLVKEAGYQLGPISSDEFHREVQALKNIGKRAGEWIKAHSGPIKPVINAIFKKAELDPPDLDASKPAETPTESWSYRLERLVGIALELGYESVYILVDKVDELPETSADPDLAFALVAPLITHLPSLEMPRVGYKVFLWDKAQNTYIDNGGRPDRIKDFTLGWDSAALSEMMARRLSAHSDGAVVSLNALIDPGAHLDLHRLVAELAQGSPRDMVRLAKEIRDVHLNGAQPTGLISRDEVFEGIKVFSSRIAEERSRKFMPDLLKINECRFTQNRLSNDILKISKQSVQAKVTDWRKTGLIEKVTELQDARNRPQHLYGIVDARLAIAMRQDMDVEMVLDQLIVFCPTCKRANISDEASIVCIGCQSEFQFSDAQTLMDACSI